MICGKQHLLDQICGCHTWSFTKPLKDLPLKDPYPYKSYDELEQELEEANAKLKFIYEECEAKFYFSSGDFDYVEIDDDCWDNINWKQKD